nr:unnamed protein product [Digitaria exilis]
MLHSTPSHTSVPSSFVFPPEHLKPATSAAVSLPVIDMSGSLDEMEAIGEEFFRLPAADKAGFYSESEDPNKATPRLFSNTTYETGGEKHWRDCLRLVCSLPIRDSVKDWPDKPHRLWEVTENFMVLTRDLAMKLLRLLCEGMGFRPEYFEGDICGDHVIVDINHYPPCPDPSTTLGLPPHCDQNVITLLLPSMVPGLEVAYKGDWIKVQPIPQAFVVNFGSQLEVLTNGMLKSIEHRVTTNWENRSIYNVVKLGESLNLTTNLKDVQKKI